MGFRASRLKQLGRRRVLPIKGTKELIKKFFLKITLILGVNEGGTAGFLVLFGWGALFYLALFVNFVAI
jgi:hypothetical protein